MALTDTFTNAPRPQKIAAGIVAVVVLAGIGYFAVSPKLAEREALRQRHAALQTDLIKARADEANLRPFRREAEAMRKRLELAKARLPAEREIPALYRQLSDLAFQSGLAVTLFAPKAPEDRDMVAEIPITVTAEGTYHQLGGFFSRMARIARIVNLGDFKVAGIDRPTGTLRADLTLATYLLRADAAAPPAPPAPGSAPVAPPPAPIPGARARGVGL
jgi:type IV pilus assembly protein PilO